jgi:myo-inositol catabolism protein IolS
MQYRQLGQSGVDVSVLSFGAWQLADSNYWGEGNAHDPKGAVHAALDGGINLFDTAEIYGEGASEEVLGEALGARSSEVLIASKVSPEHCTPEGVRSACEGSLSRLKRDYIDLYQIHWPFPVERFADVYAVLEDLREEGKIRFVGLSNFGAGDLGEWLNVGDVASNQLGYNLLFRAIEYEILPACRRNQLGVLAYMPLMQGILAGRWKSVPEIPIPRRRTRHFSMGREGVRHGESGNERQLILTVENLRGFSEAVGLPLATVSLCWLLAQPGVTSAVIGGRTPEQVARNIDAATLNIGPAAIAQLCEDSGQLKRDMGVNADLWEGSKESRIR